MPQRSSRTRWPKTSKLSPVSLKLLTCRVASGLWADYKLLWAVGEALAGANTRRLKENSRSPCSAQRIRLAGRKPSEYFPGFPSTTEQKLVLKKMHLKSEQRPCSSTLNSFTEGIWDYAGRAAEIRDILWDAQHLNSRSALTAEAMRLWNASPLLTPIQGERGLATLFL